MPYPHTFATLSGNVPASYLDDNFNAAAEASDLAALDAQVQGLPGSATPLPPAPAGVVGMSGQFSRQDHRHPAQPADINLQTGTSYTIQASDNGKVVEFDNGSAITVTVPATLDVGFSCLLVQVNTGQVTVTADSGATQNSYNGDAKLAGQWAMATLYVRDNPGGAAAEYVLAGNLSP